MKDPPPTRHWKTFLNKKAKVKSINFKQEKQMKPNHTQAIVKAVSQGSQPCALCAQILHFSIRHVDPGMSAFVNFYVDLKMGLFL